MRNYTLAALVLIVGLYAYFGVFRKEANEKEAEKLASQFVPWDQGQTVALSFTGPEGEVSLVRDERGWVFEKPFQDRADLTAVDTWLISLVNAERKNEVYSAGETFDSETFGLKEPDYRITVKSRDGAVRELEVGSKRVFDQDIYVYDQTTKTLSTFGSALETALKKPAFELRDRRVWRVKDPLASQVELVGEWKLQKGDLQNWKFEPEKPGDLSVGVAEVDQYLVDVSNLRLLEVVSESSSDSDLKKFGLDRPFAQLSIEGSSESGPVIFKFSRQRQDAGDIFVSSSSFDFIGRLYSSVLDSIKVERHHFFDKKLPFQKIAASEVGGAQFELDQKGGQVDQEKVPAVVSEIHKLKLKEYLPNAPRLGRTNSLSLKSSGEGLVFKMTWEDLKDKSGEDVRVVLEPGRIAGKMRASDIEGLVKVVLPPPPEQETGEAREQGESSSVQ